MMLNVGDKLWVNESYVGEVQRVDALGAYVVKSDATEERWYRFVDESRPGIKGFALRIELAPTATHTGAAMNGCVDTSTAEHIVPVRACDSQGDGGGE